MPLVEAAGYAYRPYPSTDASVTVPDDYQRIPNATPAAFGAAVGEALTQGSDRLRQVGNELAGQAVARQEIYNKIAMDEGQTRFSEGLNEKMYGNSKTGVVGLMGLHGEDAMRRHQEIFGKGGEAEQLRDQIGSTMPNARARIDYNTATRHHATIMGEVGSAHYAREMDKYGEKVQTARVSNAINTGALNYNNPDIVNTQLNIAIDAGIKIAQNVAGSTVLSGPIHDQAVSTAIDGFIEGQVKAWTAQGEFGRAYEILKNPGLIRPGLKISNPDMAVRLDNEINQKRIEAETGGIIFRNGGLGATSGSGIVPPAPVAPEVYKPVINQAATQHNVPEELLTRVLSAESDFNPTARGPTFTIKATGETGNAKGIAQFIDSTARDRGLKNPDDPNEAIPAAAAYLAQLHTETGSWHGAVNKYLGGETKNNERYTQKGVWQLADQLDHPNAAPPATPAGAPAATGGFSSPGASIPPEAKIYPSTGEIEVWGDSLGDGINDMLRTPGHTRAGAPADDIRREIETQPASHWAGKTVVLASGSNGPNMKEVRDTIQYLQDKNANVVLVGYGTKGQLPQRNAQLNGLAQEFNVPIVQAESVGPDGVHPTSRGYDSMTNKIRSLHTQMAASTPKPGALATSPKPILQFVDGKWVPYLPEGI